MHFIHFIHPILLANEREMCQKRYFASARPNFQTSDGDPGVESSSLAPSPSIAAAFGMTGAEGLNSLRMLFTKGRKTWRYGGLVGSVLQLSVMSTVLVHGCRTINASKK